MSIITDVLALLETVRKKAEEINDSKISAELAALQGAIMKLQQENFEVIMENQELKKQIQLLHSIEVHENNIERSNGAIAKYRKDNKQFMICTNCWDSVNVNLKMYKYGEMKLYNYGGLVLSSVLIITAIY
jgi:regulator of replication initiation timing